MSQYQCINGFLDEPKEGQVNWFGQVGGTPQSLVYFLVEGKVQSFKLRVLDGMRGRAGSELQL